MLKWSCCVAGMLMFLISLLCAQGHGPVGPPSPPPIYTTPGIALPETSTTGFPNQLERQAQIQMERDRQLALKRETDQLLAMASDLKQNMDKTSPAILSLDLIKKTEKIEKLAKSIREKMKGN